MSSLVAKRITQETFDEVVKENVEEFEMDEKEALAEAVKQFESQGVSLANIDTTGGVGRAEMEAAMEEMLGSSGNEDAVCASLRELNELCDASHVLGARNRTLLVTYKSASAFNALHALIAPSQSANTLVAAMKLMKTVAKSSVEARDFFEPNGSLNLVSVVNAQQHKDNALVVNAAFELARCAAKSENNKFQLMKKGLGEFIAGLLSPESVGEVINENSIANNNSSSSSSSSKASILQNACMTMRGLCIHDDLRREMSCAMDNGKFFINAINVVPALMQLSSAFKAQAGVAGAALSAAKTLVTTEEAVQVMAQHGAMDLPRAILGYPAAATTLVRHLLGLARNLCADDLRKDRLVSDGTLELLVASLSDAERSADAVLAEHGLACLAAMSLRSPSNATRIMTTGAAEVMVRCLRRHADKPAVQRQGCLAIRNIAARCPEYRMTLLDAGAEPVLRAAGRHQAAVDEAYGALRDLGVDVQKVRITEDGRVEAAYEQFGAAAAAGGGERKLKFNPVYDDSINLAARVEEEAHAPFEAPSLRPFQQQQVAGSCNENDGHNHASCAGGGAHSH